MLLKKKSLLPILDCAYQGAHATACTFLPVAASAGQMRPEIVQPHLLNVDHLLSATLWLQGFASGD